MNLALFLTRENAAQLEIFAQEAARLQEERVNGALLLARTNQVDDALCQRILSTLGARFAQSALIKSSANTGFSSAGQCGVLFSLFLMKAYSRYPGPWMVVDSACRPTRVNFMQHMARMHGAGGGVVSGRSINESQSRITVGPVVIELLARELKALGSYVGESWRARGQYLFSRVNFNTIPLEDYPFFVGDSSQPTEQPAEKAPAKPAATLPDVSEYEGLALEDLDRDQLFHLMWARTGERPHPQIGRERLLARLAPLAD
jgi:hypothetical protein